MGYETVIGDILDAPEDAIMQQCNCVTISPKGLSKAIFDKWDYANDYRGRKISNRPEGGTISIKRPTNEQDGKIIVNMFAQYYPSPPRFVNDSTVHRLRWFESCLKQIEDQLIKTNHNSISSIAFPYKIGCGLAGGDWKMYEVMMKNFATRNPTVKVVMYKLPDQ